MPICVLFVLLALPVVWDKELERKVSKMTCDRMVTGPDYSVAVIPTEKAMASSEWSAELLVNIYGPTQTKMGCFEFHPEMLGSENFLIRKSEVGSWKNKIDEVFKRGKPGCPGETRTDGLCVTQVEHVEEVKEAPKSVEAKMGGADVTPSESNSYFVSFYMVFLCAAIMAYASQ